MYRSNQDKHLERKAHILRKFRRSRGNRIKLFLSKTTFLFPAAVFVVFHHYTHAFKAMVEVAP